MREKEVLNGLPGKVKEYIEVGRMIQSRVYPPHKVVLLKDIQERLMNGIVEDTVLFDSLMEWRAYEQKGFLKRLTKRRKV